MIIAEMQLHREKGLCYMCDEKFPWNHKCHKCRYFIMQAEYDDLGQQDNEAKVAYEES